MAVPLEIAFALFLAILLNGIGRGAGFFRTVYYLPKMTPVVATAAVFFLLLNGNSGAINQGLGVFGIEGPQWLVDPAWVKPSIVLMTLWAVSGTMVIFLAALKNVPRELYEVASLDGAGPVRRFCQHHAADDLGRDVLQRHRADDRGVPGVRPGVPAVLARPEQRLARGSLFYAVYLFQQAFRQFNFGFAAAMAWLLFVIIMLITFMQMRVGNRFVYYEGDR